ncbi:hypothetical protein FYZ48_18945 [Gimesia chilikensis]|uniref:hypothetical protein n=1 Tax=Gimesia chilikensis TaxID=2605989 RepID=UPI0011EC74FE|nr:hypothetical protein [Gimesia chilikensis]KAA0135388.1 hypothetical protein FYZ48_18945 [Gimesia chilikensis]
MDFRPWMIEAAYDFIRSSRLLWDNNLYSPSMVNVGVGLEILFKSFNAEIDGPQSTTDEPYMAEHYRYAGAHTHNLSELFDKIPKAIRNQLGIQPYRDYLIDKFDTLFVSARYPYEKEALSGGTEAIIDVAEEIIAKIIAFYKLEGCDDKWIRDFPDVVITGNK